jgi:hypothetical protein
MDYFMAADKRTLVAICQGVAFSATLKVHWFSKGLTRTQAALAFLEFLSGVEFDRDQKSWRKLRRVLDREPEVAGVLFNNPPIEDPIVREKFYSLDSASVEMWLREVFGVYRKHLPPFVSSLQQDWETWTLERWTNVSVPGAVKAQAATALRIHSLIGQMVEEKAQAKAQKMQAEAAATLEEMVKRSQQTIWAEQAQAGAASQVWSEVQRPSTGPVLAPVFNSHYDQSR